jgi:hypothetical protein
MGYILKNTSGGGGGGDATAANQLIQITEAQELNLNTTDSVLDSVFKETANNSVFKDQPGNSVFRDNFDTSTFNTSGYKSILKQSKISSPTTLVESFQNTTPALLASDIQTWLQANNVVIIQICYADAGGVAPNPHTALIIHNIV